MQDALDRFVEQIAVVADHQHGVRIALDEVFQPERAFEVEIVRRLVQEQDVGGGEQRARKRNAHAPAAASAEITPNAKLPGKFSKVERQIDLLIEERASDFAFRIVIDAKYRGRKIDVGDVEAFIGLTRDVEAHTGMMVALEGYTPAAVNRAHNDDLDIILDVLNLDELKAFQGPTAIPYSGEYGVSIAAPFGWVMDATRRPQMLASTIRFYYRVDQVWVM